MSHLIALLTYLFRPAPALSPLPHADRLAYSGAIAAPNNRQFERT